MKGEMNARDRKEEGFLINGVLKKVWENNGGSLTLSLVIRNWSLTEKGNVFYHQGMEIPALGVPNC